MERPESSDQIPSRAKQDAEFSEARLGSFQEDAIGF